MTLSTTDNTKTFVGDNVTVAFAFPFLFFANTDLIVTIDNVLQILDTDYTVTGAGDASGGTITFTTAPALNTSIVIQRVVAFDQQTDFENFDGNPADVTEKQFDLVVMQTQQINEINARTLLTPIGTTLTTNVIAGTINATVKLLALSTAGPTVEDIDAADLATLAAISGDITTVANISTDVTAVAGNAADISTVAAINANVTTVANISADVTTTANNDANITIVATDIANVNLVAGSIADVNTAAEAFASALKFTFDSSIVMADPGIGDIRFNNATLTSVTAIAIDAQTAQAGNPDISDFIATWDDSTNPSTKGQLRIVKGSEPATFVIFDVTAVVDNTGWLQITVSHVDSNGTFSDTDDTYLSFTRTGDQGAVSLAGNNDFTGINTFAGKTAFKDAGELTIAAGVITATGTSHTIDTEADAASDDLDTINGGIDGEWLTIRAQDATRDIVIKDGTGNIETFDGIDITLDTTEKVVTLQFDAELVKWLVISAPQVPDIILPGHLSITVFNAADTAHDMTFTTGKATDSTDVSLLTLSSALTKQIDAAFAAGDNAGGLFTGTVAANTTYHMFVIEKDSDGSIDGGFDTSVTAANIPVGFTKFRRVASIKTNGSSNIINFVQDDDEFIYTGAIINDVTLVNPGTAAVLSSLSVPTGIKVKALVNVGYSTTSGSASTGLITSPSSPDTVPSASFTTFPIFAVASGFTRHVRQYMEVKTNTSGQIRSRLDVSSASVTLFIATLGYTDTRGR